MDGRARLTIPDVVFTLLALAFLRALYPVFWDGFEANLSEMRPGTELLFQLMLPLLVLVLLSVVWVKAIGGRA